MDKCPLLRHQFGDGHPRPLMAVLLAAAALMAAAAAAAVHAEVESAGGVPGASAPLPVQRHAGTWSAPPARIPTAFMFDSPIVGNGDAGVTFGGPPSLTTFYASSNSFWSSNQQVDARPNFNSKPGGSESYTQVRIGDVKLAVPALANATYHAAQDLYRATINATYASPRCTLTHSTYIASGDDNLAVTTLRASGGGCGDANITLQSGFLAGHYGPVRAGLNGSTLLASRDSVSTVHNKLTASYCFNAGQQTNSQRWINGSTLRLVDARCLATVPAENGTSKITIGACSATGGTEGWHLAPMGGAGLVLTSTSGKCAGLDANGEFLVAVDSCSAATQWAYDAPSQHVYSLAAGNHKWGQGRCLTAVEPNPLVIAAMALRVVDSSGAAVPVKSASTSPEQHHSSFTISLDALTGPVTMLTAIITKGNCTGCDADITDPEGAASALVDRHAQDSAAAAGAAHSVWWAEYWNAGAKVDLGPEWKRLESFYYGMHYQIGSASRADRFAPGLWGPWITDETCGWSGDYTLNYNFEANYYGVFSDNRPELVQPFFKTILNHVELGQWRASMEFWGDGVSAATPGFWAQDFNHMDQLSTDHSGFVKAGYKGIQLPTHFSPWKHFYFVSDWGQKNVGSFTTKAFMDYYDYTQNTTFLRETLYPLCKLNGDFYASYMSKIDGKYNVMHSCAMEGCGAQGPETSSNIVVSNNPPFDLAFVKRTFRGLLEYSTKLGVDSDSHAQWEDILANVADYPLTVDEHGETVFAQATLNDGPTSTSTDGFPNASSCIWSKDSNKPDPNAKKCGHCRMHCPNATLEPAGGCQFPCATGSNGNCCVPCRSEGEQEEGVDMAEIRATTESSGGCGNARYPITFFNAMHPGEDVDLSSDAGTLKIARRTTDVINAINDYSPTNGLCMAWPPAARVVNSTGTAALLHHFDTALQHTMMPNFIPFINNRPTGGSGCNIENSGATVAINDLLASVHGHGKNSTLRMFSGGWPAGQAVSFEKIRVRGAFTVGASASGIAGGKVKLTGPVTVASLAGNSLRFLWPAEGAAPVVKEVGGGPVAAAEVGADTWQIHTTVGTSYSIA